MTPELAALATARHAAFVAWDANSVKGVSRTGLAETFLAANKAYVQARDKQQRQITASTKAA